MGKRGPKPAANANVTTLTVVTARRPPVPRKLQPYAAAVWRDTVGAKPADFFQPTDIPILTRYCVLLGMAEEAEDKIYLSEIERPPGSPEPKPGDPVDRLVKQVRNGYPVASPHIGIMQSCTQLAASLSVKLRLNGNAKPEKGEEGDGRKKTTSGRSGLMFPG